MAQIEIYNFLKTERQKGNEEFLSATEIIKALKNGEAQPSFTCSNNNIYVGLMQLEAYGYLEIKMRGAKHNNSWKRTYRLKLKYCEQPKE